MTWFFSFFKVSVHWPFRQKKNKFSCFWSSINQAFKAAKCYSMIQEKIYCSYFRPKLSKIMQFGEVFDMYQKSKMMGIETLNAMQ